MKPVIINFTPNGSIPTRAMTPHVPISPSEVVEQTHAAFEMGITLVHLHARDTDSQPTLDPLVYQQIMEGIRQYCPGLAICLSLSGRNVTDPSKRAAPLQLKPDMASLTLSSLNFSKQAMVNEPDIIQFLTAQMLEYGVRPEFEVFDTGMINYAYYLIKKQKLRSPFYFNFIFGGIATAQLHPLLIEYMREQLPSNSYCALGGMGDYQLPAHQYAVANGFGVRVGLEDNIYWDAQRDRLATNVDLVKRIHELAAAADRTVMTSTEFRLHGFSNANHG